MIFLSAFIIYIFFYYFQMYILIEFCSICYLSFHPPHIKHWINFMLRYYIKLQLSEFIVWYSAYYKISKSNYTITDLKN